MHFDFKKKKYSAQNIVKGSVTRLDGSVEIPCSPRTPGDSDRNRNKRMTAQPEEEPQSTISANGDFPKKKLPMIMVKGVSNVSKVSRAPNNPVEQKKDSLPPPMECTTPDRVAEGKAGHKMVGDSSNNKTLFQPSLERYAMNNAKSILMTKPSIDQNAAPG